MKQELLPQTGTAFEMGQCYGRSFENNLRTGQGMCTLGYLNLKIPTVEGLRLQVYFFIAKGFWECY